MFADTPDPIAAFFKPHIREIILGWHDMDESDLVNIVNAVAEEIVRPAYEAGQDAMRERAAKVAEESWRNPDASRSLDEAIAEAIRALPILPAPSPEPSPSVSGEEG